MLITKDKFEEWFFGTIAEADNCFGLRKSLLTAEFAKIGITVIFIN